MLLFIHLSKVVLIWSPVDLPALTDWRLYRDEKQGERQGEQFSTFETRNRWNAKWHLGPLIVNTFSRMNAACLRKEEVPHDWLPRLCVMQLPALGCSSCFLQRLCTSWPSANPGEQLHLCSWIISGVFWLHHYRVLGEGRWTAHAF